MFSSIECPLCRYMWEGGNSESSLGSTNYYTCQRCGNFGAEFSIFERLSLLPVPVRRHLIRWLKEEQNNSDGNTALITEELISRFSRAQPIRITDMADSLLWYCVTNSERLGFRFNLSDPDLARACFAFDEEELSMLACYLVDLGLANMDGPLIQITARGFSQIDEGGMAQTDSRQVFIAMWFSEELSDVLQNGFARAISDSGYFSLRIDQKEHNKKIDDEIIAEIRRSKFMVADFTGHRGGVYFEAGFALGLGIPVIWTCRKSDIDKLHFDIRQYNCIDWDNAENLRARLGNRIVALLGSGSNKGKS